MTSRIREFDGGVVAATRAMYASLGDRAGFDAHLHPEVTIWETDQPAGLIGLAELDALRDRRAPEPGAPPPVLSVVDPVVDRLGDLFAVIRYVLRAEVDEAVTTFRVTDVLVGGDPDAGGPGGSGAGAAGWRIVHHHAERVVPTGQDASSSTAAAQGRD